MPHFISNSMTLFKHYLFRLLLGIFLLPPSLLSAQTPQPGITLNLINATAPEVFTAIERQSDYNFIYEEKVKGYAKKISIQVTDAPIEKVLNELSRQSSLSFKKINKNIAVSLNYVTDATGTLKVSGFVNSAKDKLPVVNATVYIKDTPVGTVTDMNGAFTINVPQQYNLLTVAATGYTDQTVLIDKQEGLAVSLVPGAGLEEVVVIGYGSQLSDKVSGSISRITADKLENMPITSFEQGLVGQMAGVEVVQSSGSPGGDVQIRIRGISTITAGTKPLIVLDGLPLSDNNTSSLNHSDIASVEVLKDAAAAAIYGSRGSNGVILITTKKGSSGKPVFNFETYTGMQAVSHKIKMMDAYEMASLIAAARNNSWIDHNPQKNSATDPNNLRNDNKYSIPPFIFPYLERQKGLVNTDWQDEVFRIAPQQNYNLSLSGTEKKVTYFISANYLNQEGVVINSGMKRYTGRINVEAKPTPKFVFGINLSPSYTTYDLISEQTYKDDGIVLSALMALPFFSPRNTDGSLRISEHINAGDYSTVWLENPVALATQIDNTLQRFKLFGNSYATYDITKHLRYKLQAGAEWNTYNESYFRPSTLGTYRGQAPTVAAGRYYTGKVFNWILENTLNYNRVFNSDHTLDVLAGYTAQAKTMEQSYMGATNFPNNNVHTLNAGLINEGNTSKSEYAIVSMLARVNYDYKAKYIVSAALRRDGSSRFGDRSKWGWFPAFSAAWRISKEAFFPQSGLVNELKLKASYGRTGNNQIPDYGSVALMEPSNYVFGNTLQTGLATATSPNENLSWEKTDMINTGLNIGLLGNKLTASVEYFRSETKDLLLNVPVPATSGYEMSLQNIGRVRNEGYELSIGINLKAGGFKWNSFFNFSSYRNEVREVGKGQERIVSDYHITQIGSPIGSYYGYRLLGVYKSQEELNTYPHLPTSTIGSYIYEDVNKDGQITDADRKVIGNYLPDFSIGFSNTFSYKNFSLSIVAQAVQGFEVYNLTRAFTTGVQGWSNGLESIYDGYYQSEAQPGNGIARPLTRPTDKNYELSDFMVEDGSFIRIRSISIGYTLPKKIIRHARLDKCSIYIAAKNPFTFTKYSGYNPEVSSWRDPMTPGVDYGAYPVEKSYVAGLNIKF
jgi:TonB-linked SusC/RagA family outer membrane protein